MTGASWWAETTAVALLGTGRRPPLPLPTELSVAARDDASDEEALLDAAALGGMLRAAGRTPAPAGALAPAPADDWAPAPDRAVHLLQLILGQPPFGARLATPALRRWLAIAAERERRVPHAELPRLLTTASKAPDLRPAVARVADARGRWLAGINPAWDWLAVPDAGGLVPVTPSVEQWATMPTKERIALLGHVRLTDPAAGRALLESTWASESGRDRPLLLASLRDGLGPDDEELLERALDDRAAGVRDAARSLLDRLPGSARAARLAERLRASARMSGRLRRSLEVDLPTDPDPSAVRDGLVRKPAGGASERGFWLEQLAAGAPLSVWTDITGRDVNETYRLIAKASPEARTGVVRAARVRRDVDWLREIAADTGDAGLVALLPADDAVALAMRHIPRVPTYGMSDLLVTLPRPWSAGLADAVLSRVAAEKLPDWLLDALLPLLADALPAEAVPRLQRWARADGAPRSLPLLVQYLSFVPAIPEAFG